MITILYFSPTGNGRHLAGLLGKELSGHQSVVKALEDGGLVDGPESEHLVLIYPIHGFNPPGPVVRFAKGLPPGLFGRVSLLAAGCADSPVNRAVSTGLRKILERKGYSLLVDEVIAMPLTFIMAFPDDYSRDLVACAEGKIREIAGHIVSGTPLRAKPAFLSRLAHWIGKAERPAARFFGLELRAGKDCVSCGLCADECPAGNIRMDGSGKPRFRFSCLMCMRCIYNCPQKAIAPRFSRFIPIKEGYSIEKFTIEENREI